MTHRFLVVRLDSAEYPAGPGRVIAHVSDVGQFLAMRFDRHGEGTRADLRLWRGTAEVGDRVVLMRAVMTRGARAGLTDS